MGQPNYYSIIPANVRYDEELTPNAKLLYGEITSLCDKEGYCWATNEYFAKLYNVSNRSIQEWLNKLEQKQYILREFTYIENSREVKERKILILPSEENFIPMRKKLHEGREENFIENNTSINIKEINNNKLLFIKKSFKKPTLDEVQQYCIDRKNNINAEQFIDYYESNGWKVGRNPMKDWKACVRTWEKREKKDKPNVHKSNYEISQEALRKAREEFGDE